MKNKRSAFRMTLAMLVLLSFGLASSSFAQSNKPKPNASSSSDYDWNGFYAGLNLGFGLGNTNVNFTPLPSATTFANLLPTTLKPTPRGVLGGVQTGYNWTQGKFLLGAEVDVQGTAMNGTQTITPIVQNNNTPFPGAAFISAGQSTKWIGTFRPRLGWLVRPRLLLYGTAGLAFGNVNQLATTDFRPTGTTNYTANINHFKAGWTAGAGGEYFITNHWSVKGEYLYYTLGNDSETVNPVPALPPFQIKYDFSNAGHIIKFGVNYFFKR